MAPLPQSILASRSSIQAGRLVVKCETECIISLEILVPYRVHSVCGSSTRCANCVLYYVGQKRQDVIASERSERGDLMLLGRIQRRFETHRLHPKGTSSLRSQRFVLRPRNDTSARVLLRVYLTVQARLLLSDLYRHRNCIFAWRQRTHVVWIVVTIWVKSFVEVNHHRTVVAERRVEVTP